MMAMRGLVGAVYKNDAAPVSENIALLFGWTLEVQHRKEYTYGPELHAIPIGWHVKAEAYWTVEAIEKGQAFVRLFIDKGEDMRCLAGQVELPALKKTEGVCESDIKLDGIGRLTLCETK